MPLKKQLGFLPVMLSGIGIILGAGIYALVGKAAGIAGYGVWLSFVLAALVAAFTGLSYAELSAMIPKAGAEFHYAKKAFGKSIGFFTGWILILAGIISATTVALGFGGYFQALTGIPLLVASILLLVACVGIICLGIRQSTGIASVFTIIEAFGLFVIILIGLPVFFSKPEILSNVLNFNAFSIPLIVQGAALVFFAFIGFEEIVRLAEETKNSEKTIPKALLVAIAVSTILYILVSISAVSVLTPTQLGESNAPLGDVAGKVFGNNAFFLLAVIALFSTANTVLLILLATSRILYGIAEDKELPHIIARIDKKTNTPIIAVLVSGIFSIMLLFFENITLVAHATDFLIFIAFIIINSSVIKLRFSLPNVERPFKIPLNLGKIPITAVFGIITCFLLMTGVSIEIALTVVLLSIIGIIFELFYKKKHLLFKKSV